MCDYPINIKNPLYGRRPDEMQRILVPCSKCVKCNQRKSNQWFVRLHYQLKESTSAHFVTLTYKHPPRSANDLLTCKKHDLQTYFKRLRKRECFNNNIKYYAVSEYGEKYNRPHYHAIIFNVENERNLERAWTIDKLPIGNLHIGEVTDASIRYVTGYIGKKIGVGKTENDDRLPEFSLMSKNMGNYFTDKILDYNEENLLGYTRIDGIKYVLPRYYKNKMDEYTKRKISKINQHEFINAQNKQIKNFPSINDWEKNSREAAQHLNRSKQTIINPNF